MSSPFTAGSRVVTYLRHSPGEQQSLDSQEHAVSEWCSEHPLEIHRQDKDESRSGTTVAGRDLIASHQAARVVRDLGVGPGQPATPAPALPVAPVP